MQSESLVNRASRSSSFFREASMDENDPLVRQRKESLVPLTRSPFTDTVDTKPGELSVTVSEVEWSDLLLEVAMTTAFASLTDGTPILEASNVTSYLSFFALVWWVWASQVAYNVRFRQADWLHRMFIFFQVFVFCALAAFTSNFDITNGIADDSKEQQQISDLQVIALGDSEFARPLLDVQNFRDERLPTLNVRGVSMTMACSRLLLLAQYSIAFYHSVRRDGRLQFSRQSAFLAHMGSLIFSSLCYFIAFGVIGKDPDKDDQIAKIVLWYFPLFVEIGIHYLAVSHLVRGRVPYKSEWILARSSSVFVIILGGGLDKITNGFQFIIGTVSFGKESFGLIFCGVVVFILLFSLYFGTSEPDRVGSRRSLSLLFFQFFYLAAIIVTLQGIATMLQAGNLGNALDLPFDFLRESKFIMEMKGLGGHLNESDYSSSGLEMKLEKQGVSLTTMLDFVNSWMDDAVLDPVEPDLPYNALLQMDVYIIESVLFNLKKYPDSGILLAQLDAFYQPDPNNYTVINNQTFNDLAERVIISNATPALWFYAAGGSVLVTLGLMGLIRQWPRDRYEWGQTISRLLMGSAVIAFTAIDVHASNDVLDEDFHYQGSRIWYLATHSWVLPIYALALLIEQIIELVLLHLAGRKIGNFGSSALNRSLTRAVYSRTKNTDRDELIYAKGGIHEDPESYFDPYAPYDYSEKGLVSSPNAFIASPPTSFQSQQTQSQQRLHPGSRSNKRQTSESSISPLIK